MIKQKINVAITGLNNTDNPGPGIPVIRGIRESKLFDVRFIGLAYENLEPGIYMDGILDSTYLIPYPSDGMENFLARIEYIHSKEKLDVIIPNFDAELFTFMKAANRMKDLGINTFLPTIEQYEERSKTNLRDFGKKYDVDVPRSESVTSLSDILELAKGDEYDFPLMIKGKFYDAYIAYNIDQLRYYFHTISAKWGLPVIIQEFIKGIEVNIVALGDGTGITIGAVAMKKQYITDKGKAWGGITIDDPDMMELCHKIISQTKWRGGMELELIRTDKGKYYIIEINPRIPAWVYLAVGAGQNIPEALVRLALGDKPEPFAEYKKGIMFVRYSYDIICDLQRFEKLSTRGEI